MGLDASILGTLTAEMLDEIEGVEMITAMVVVEVYDPESQTHNIGYKCSDPRGWFQAAFLDQAAEVAREPEDI